MCLLPHATDGLYGTGIGIERDHRLLPRICAYSLQRPQATDAQLRTALPRLAFQSGARRPCRRQLLGHACHRRRLGNPAAEQAQGPFINPVEMALPDPTCAVYRASQRPYRALFEGVWGPQAFAVTWPGDTEQVCNRPGPPPASDPLVVHLSSVDRGRAMTTYGSPAMRRRPRSRRSLQNLMPCWRGARNSRSRSRRATTCSSAKRAATIVIATAGLARIHCLPILAPATSERPPIGVCRSICRTSQTHSAIPPIRLGRPSSISGLEAFF